MSPIHKYLLVGTKQGVGYSGDTHYQWHLASAGRTQPRTEHYGNIAGEAKEGGEPGCCTLPEWTLPEIHPGKGPGAKPPVTVPRSGGKSFEMYNGKQMNKYSGP